jgi:hypothetical protein
MVRLGVWTNVPQVAVIDAENTSPLNLRLLHFADPSRRAGDAKAVRSGPGHPLGIFDFKPPFDVQGLPPTFRKMFLESSAGSPLVEELYELFYPEMADNVDIHKGMFAQPAVGAAVFADRAMVFLDELLTGGIQKCEKILVAGSFVGGTGAGILHRLVDFLATHRERHNKDILGAFLLPWFNLPAGASSAASDVTIANSANHGVDYFARHTHKRLRRSLLLGASNGIPAALASAGNDETVSVFPLLAAYGLTTLRDDTISNDHQAVYALTTPPDDPKCRWLLTNTWKSGGRGGESIGLRWRAARVVQTATRIMLAHRHEFDELSGHGIRSKFFKWNWSDATQQAAKLAGLKNGEQLAPMVLDALVTRTEQMEMVTSWLDQVFGNPSLGDFGNKALMELDAGTPAMDKAGAYKVLEDAVPEAEESVKAWLKGREAERAGLSAREAAAFLAEQMESSMLRFVLR